MAGFKNLGMMCYASAIFHCIGNAQENHRLLEQHFNMHTIPGKLHSNSDEIFHKSIQYTWCLLVTFTLKCTETVTDPHHICPRCLMKSMFDLMLQPPKFPIDMNPLKPFLDGKLLIYDIASH